MTRRVVLALGFMAAAGSADAAAIDRVFTRDDAQTVRDTVARNFGLDWFSESRSYALVVGISDYARGYPDLPTANDPLRMKDFLIDEAGFDHVHVLTEERATEDRIEELMEEVFPALVDGNDRFLFYWSGHGDQRTLPNGTQRGYLPLKESAPDSWAGMVSMLALQRWDDLLAARQALYLLDACFSGLAGQVAKSSPRDLAIEQLARPSRHLLTAGTGDEQAIAGAAWGGSLFTTAVLDGLRGAADAATAYAADDVVSLAELVAYVKIRVAEEKDRARWNAAITPQLRDLKTNEGEFFFAWPPAAAPTPEPVPEPLPAPEPKGLSEREVREAQEMLAEMGFAPGPADGIVGLRTRAALLRFQQERGLAETADLDPATRQALIVAWAGQPRGIEPWAREPVPAPRADELADLAVFTDTLADGSPCGFCPEMVVIAGGTFTMGSPPDELGRDGDEGPQREVRVERFALARTEVTVAQFRAFVDASGHVAAGCWVLTGSAWERDETKSWRDPGFAQTDEHPVACVSWEDAQAYVGWLSEATGQDYRLPSEAEWEFAARAGSQDAYWWDGGADAGCRYANGADLAAKETYPSWSVMACRDGHVHTSPVGRFAANPNKLFDVAGNLLEWVEDCWHVTYEDAPRDGSAWLEEDGGDCARRVLRGGSWNYYPGDLRSASRGRGYAVNPNYITGFRVSRTLTP